VERPINPCSFALGAGARFVARGYDIAQTRMPDILKRACQHKGASFVEIYQNCIVYNDAAFEEFAGKKAAPDALLWVEHGKPLMYANGTKGLGLNRERMALEAVRLEGGNTGGLDVLVHDETSKTVAQLLLDMPFGAFPIALGVLYCDPAPAFEAAIVDQREGRPAAIATSPRC
jgi:2-oxoglutarate/2-oxoacid ferredoxin oxidoreductase subunit beta